MIREVQDLRPKYAALLREMADRIEQSDKQPDGAMVEIFFTGGELARARAFEHGFNLMHALGCMEVLKQDMAQEILAAQRLIK